MALTSFYGNFLIALQEYMKTAVPEIRYIEQDLGQLEIVDKDGRPPVSFPCMLVDFEGTKYEQELNLVEIGDCHIMFRLGWAPFSSSNSLAPLNVRENALQYYETENKVYRALKGWVATVEVDDITYEICQPLNRVSDGTEKREDTLRVRAIGFTTSFEDESARLIGERINITPVLTFE